MTKQELEAQGYSFEYSEDGTFAQIYGRRQIHGGTGPSWILVHTIERSNRSDEEVDRELFELATLHFVKSRLDGESTKENYATTAGPLSTHPDTRTT